MHKFTVISTAHLDRYTKVCVELIIDSLCHFVGYYCTSGVDRSNPGASNETINCTCSEQSFNTGIGGICPLGHYCPPDTVIPIPCEAGSYADMAGMFACTECPQGFYCLANSTEFLSQECPQGHYCLSGTTHPYQYPCPRGSFNNHVRGNSSDDCEVSHLSQLKIDTFIYPFGHYLKELNLHVISYSQPCPGGQYCEGDGNIQPTGNCSAGFYCSGSAETWNDTVHGGQCEPGYYCPEGVFTN